MRGWNPVYGERPRDLGEPLTAGVLEPNPVDDALRQGRRSTGWPPLPAIARRLDMLAYETLELGNGNQPLPPRGLHGADGGNESTVDRGDAHTESRSSLLAAVGEAVDFVDLA